MTLRNCAVLSAPLGTAPTQFSAWFQSPDEFTAHVGVAVSTPSKVISASWIESVPGVLSGPLLSSKTILYDLKEVVLAERSIGVPAVSRESGSPRLPVLISVQFSP